MRAWDKLIESSTLQSGTAWDHLNSQGGGGNEIIYIESMDASFTETTLSTVTTQEVLLAESIDVVLSVTSIEQELEANFQTEALEATVMEVVFSSEVITMNLSANIVEVQ